MKHKKTHHKPVIMIDFGGVYFFTARPLIKKFSKKFGIPQKNMSDAIMGRNWAEYAVGRSNEKKYWKNVSDKLGISKKQTLGIRKEWYSLVPHDGMVDLVRKLKKNYRVAALSSITAGWVEFLEKKYRISKEFHEQHYSFDHRVDKPDAKLFLRAAKLMKTKPEDCIVIDDLKIFLAAVNKTGAKTILFKNAKQLERDLRKLGVEI